METSIHTASTNETSNLHFSILNQASHRVLSKAMFSRQTIQKQAMPRQAKHNAIGTKKKKKEHPAPKKPSVIMPLLWPLHSGLVCILLYQTLDVGSQFGPHRKTQAVSKEENRAYVKPVTCLVCSHPSRSLWTYSQASQKRSLWLVCDKRGICPACNRSLPTEIIVVLFACVVEERDTVPCILLRVDSSSEG